ncbi:uncharacterized protein LOC124712497 [Schistocerca piceifrons]|uniref:uncharacterized protein LOC124712497 n=1 Tax=Schistocerca piceifrons TaxID=274613 RepID=UPI001F5F69AB|nr:uncharacterized protein LOC124712497 [Schistocerca piceifrons]
MDQNVQEMASQHAESAENGERYAGGYQEATTLHPLEGDGENLVADHRSGRQLPPDRTGQNPILSYLLQRANTNTTGYSSASRGGVRRRITHQETIVDPRQPFPAAVSGVPQGQVAGPQISGVPSTGQNNFGTNMQAVPPQNYPATGSPVQSPGSQNFIAQSGQTYPVTSQPSGSVRNDGKVPDVNLFTTMNFYPSIVAGQPYPYASAVDSNRLESGVQGRISWPFSDYFPIVIKDPINHFYNAFTTMVEYGPESDVCGGDFGDERDESKKNGKGRHRGRTGRADATSFTGEEEGSGSQGSSAEVAKPVELSTVQYGPVVARLLVQKGGVAIAGPGGSADSGIGGTSVVGPGGIVYARPNGLAILGPGAKVISLPVGSSEPRSARDPLPAGARILAVGPTVYFHSATL